MIKGCLKQLAIFIIVVSVSLPLFSQGKYSELSGKDLTRLNQFTQGDNDSLLYSFNKNKLIKRTLTSDQLKQIRVELADGVTIPMDRVEQDLTAPMRQFESELSKASNAILGTPQVTDLIVETDDAER